VTAVAARLIAYRPMVAADLDAIMNIEREIYTHPWTRGNFSDSLTAGYHCRIMQLEHEILGYAVTMVAADEAHLLNLSIAARWQRRGYGREMLNFMIQLARDAGARSMLLEVRPSNSAGLELYASAGFVEIATRRGYYPGAGAREDAVVMQKTLA
jgi:ribosomal-protein-alanine N-acetyltransferase